MMKAMMRRSIARLLLLSKRNRNTTNPFLSPSRRFIASYAAPSFLRNTPSPSGLTSSSYSPLLKKWNYFAVQKRSMFIQTQSTPNPSSLMFYPGKPVMEVGSSDFPNARTSMNSPLAKALFGIDGVTRVFYGSDFVTVTKSDDASWDLLKPEIFAAIMDFYSSGQPLFLDSKAAEAKDTAIHEDDSEIVAMIKELLETRIRPAVQYGTYINLVPSKYVCGEQTIEDCHWLYSKKWSDDKKIIKGS